MIYEEIYFAPIGLLNMFNSGGAVKCIELGQSSLSSKEIHVNVMVKGEGKFGAYASCRPKLCMVGITRSRDR